VEHCAHFLILYYPHQVAKRTFYVAGDLIRLDYHLGKDRVTANSRLYAKDGTSQITQINPLEDKPKDQVLLEEWQVRTCSDAQIANRAHALGLGLPSRKNSHLSVHLSSLSLTQPSLGSLLTQACGTVCVGSGAGGSREGVFDDRARRGEREQGDGGPGMPSLLVPFGSGERVLYATAKANRCFDYTTLHRGSGLERRLRVRASPLNPLLALLSHPLH
jgi:hypothetical protein